MAKGYVTITSRYVTEVICDAVNEEELQDFIFDEDNGFASDLLANANVSIDKTFEYDEEDLDEDEDNVEESEEEK